MAVSMQEGFADGLKLNQSVLRDHSSSEGVLGAAHQTLSLQTITIMPLDFGVRADLYL